MKIGRCTSWAAWLLVTTLVAGCATPAGSSRAAAPSAAGSDVAIGKLSMSADEFQDFQSQPAVERRRRLDAILATHPDDFAARYLRLQAEDQLADCSAVVADSEVILANPALDRRLRPAVLDQRAEALIQLRRFPEAIAAATEALDIDGSDSPALFARGWTRFHQDQAQTDDALADLDRALQLRPDEGIGHYRRAVVLQVRGALDRAAEDFARAVQLAPDDVPTRLAYGDMLMQTKDFEGALAQFDVAVRLKPGDPAAWVGRAQAHLSLALFDDVIADARHAMELGATDDDLANAHSYLGSALWGKSDFAGAAREFQLVLAVGDDPWIARRLALMQWYSGQLPQAIQSFRGQVTQPDASPYTPLWLFIVRVHANPAEETEASDELATLAPSHKPHVWVDTLVDLMLGRTTIEAALVEADAADTYQLRAGRRCEADYYAAERLLLHGQREPANGLLEEAYWVCPSTYTEATAVGWERSLLEARPQSR